MAGATVPIFTRQLETIGMRYITTELCISGLLCCGTNFVAEFDSIKLRVRVLVDQILMDKLSLQRLVSDGNTELGYDLGAYSRDRRLLGHLEN
jgi:hypothetical protein